VRAQSTPILRATACLLAVSACSEPQPEPVRPTRVVLITLDTLRYDGLPVTASDPVMPEAHAVAGAATSFSRFYATASTTQPTHASVMTGDLPWEHGVTRNGVVLDEKHETVAERFKAHGYETRAVVASFPLHEMFGFAQGFDSYDDDFDETYVQEWEGESTEAGTFFSLSDSVTERALALLDAAEGDRQFFWFHYFDAHDPYGDSGAKPDGPSQLGIQRLLRLALEKSPRLDAKLGQARAAYDRDLGAIDRSLGRLFARLRADADEQGIETHVLITSDHGESFGELGSMGHGKRLTKEQVHVPLVIVSPRVEPGARNDLASSVDVPRTLLSMAGLPHADFAGRDLTSDATGGVGGPVFGMRRTFAEPKAETRTDGSQPIVPDRWFFTLRNDVLLTGNADIVLEGDDAARVWNGEDAELVRGAFASLELLLEAAESGEEILDPDAQARLRALGYGR
jgi:arylsulfatase A-like enzyme